MLSHRLLLAWGAILSSEGVTPFSGCSEPSLPNPGALSLASHALKHRDPSCIILSRSALRAIIDGRQSAHTGIPAVLEERAMPVIAQIFTSLQTLPSTAFIFLIFKFILATLPILVFIFLE
jgi:ABC-type proline/glycine betaine transport system permease subunit